MAYHYIDRQPSEPWHQTQTIYKFWIRRFFRIAPLFYLLLVLSFFIGPLLGECREVIASHWPATATATERYNDNGLINLLIHLSFTFGFIPDYSFRSPLPDWSIGLEMQFYVAFPFIMLMMLNIGPVVSTIGLLLSCLILKAIFPEFFHSFPMPSFLLIKLYMFMIGIWIAYSRWQMRMFTGLIVALCIGFAWVYIEKGEQAWARIVLIMGMFYLMDNGTMPMTIFLQKPIHWLRDVFSSRISVFLGETSYACYLIHLLIVIPVCAWLTNFDFYTQMNGFGRFITSLLIVSVPVYFSSWLLYNYVEKNGIKMGKAFIKRL